MAPKRLTKEVAQHTGFARLARELSCDESEASFNTKLAKVARASVARKPAKRAKAVKPQAAGKPKAAKADAPAKKKIRFNLPGA